MALFVAEYEATHRHSEPPRQSWHWPPRPGAPAESPPPRVVIAPPYQAQPDMPYTAQHQAERWLSQYTLPPGWPQPNARAWSTTHHSAAPRWEGQELHNTPQWSWWPDQWNTGWSNGSSWSGRWDWTQAAATQSSHGKTERVQRISPRLGALPIHFSARKRMTTQPNKQRCLDLYGVCSVLDPRDSLRNVRSSSPDCLCCLPCLSVVSWMRNLDMFLSVRPLLRCLCPDLLPCLPN